MIRLLCDLQTNREMRKYLTWFLTIEAIIFRFLSPFLYVTFTWNICFSAWFHCKLNHATDNECRSLEAILKKVWLTKKIKTTKTETLFPCLMGSKHHRHGGCSLCSCLSLSRMTFEYFLPLVISGFSVRVKACKGFCGVTCNSRLVLS